MTDKPVSALSQQAEGEKLVAMAVYSTVAFIGCYLVYNTIYMIVTACIAATFHIPTEIHYWKTTYNCQLWWWNQPNVIFTFSSGPISCVVLGSICLRLFFIFRKTKNWLRLFFLWGYHHGFNLFFGAYVAGVISRSGFRHASNWAAIPQEIEYFIAIGAVICMFLVGFLSVKFFLQMAVSQSLLVNYKRNRYITAVVFIPWCFGALSMILLKAPNITYNEALIFLMMFTSVVPVYIAQRFFYEVSILRYDKKIGIPIRWLIVVGLSMAAFRYVLDDGILIQFVPVIKIEWINHWTLYLSS
jgi:hypothetical protein